MAIQDLAPPAAGPPRSRTPALVNTAIAVVLVLVLATLALQAVQSPPPAVAEFAPQVQQQIKQALQNQGSEVGGQAGEGQGGGGVASPLPLPSPPEKQVPQNQVKHCVGNPPRQIEDTQSPPCIPYWEGNNGGATTRGVDAQNIYVVVWPKQNPTGENYREFEALRKFFNTRFQLYGRQLVFEYCGGNTSSNNSASGSNGHTEAAIAFAGCSSSQDSDAQSAGAPVGHVPFASSGYNGGYYDYDKDLACNDHVLTLVAGTIADAYQRNPASCLPYYWQYTMSPENMNAMIGQWTCSRLAGRPARFAGGADTAIPPAQLNIHTRKFGAIISDVGEGAGDPTSTPAVYNHLLNELKVCGVNIDSKDMMVLPGNTYDPSVYTNGLVQMKNDNVTSVFCLAGFGVCIQATKIADQLPYFPEWMTHSFSFLDSDFVVKSIPADQRVRMFGLSMLPKMVLPSEDMWVQAMHEGDPADPLPGDSTAFLIRIQYWELLLLVSGIQMAGPNLTPQTFANGLWHTTFPNPDSYIHEGKVGFAGGSPQMTADAAEWFISNTASGPYSDNSSPGQGVVCYVNHGLRTNPGGWGRGDDGLFFPSSGACDSGG